MAQLKSCFKFRELDTDSFNRNWLESYLYMNDWLAELNPSNKSWISDCCSSTNSDEIEPDEWTKEFEETPYEEWETESETELNVHVRDWISEFGDWETISVTKVHVPTIHGFEDNNRQDTIKITTCAICLEEFDKVMVFGSTDSCRHKFCILCIKRWANFNHTCPLDRSPFKYIIVRYCGLIIDIIDLPPILPSTP